jgi:uncharacterized protein DUF992
MKPSANVFTNIFASCVLAISIISANTANATDNNAQIGILKCDVEGGVGLILGSKKKMTCVFTKKDDSTESYTGHVLTIGVDIGVTKDSHITWAVLAPSGKNDKGALAGSYTGVTGEVTVAGGVGAKVLVSAGNQFTLQPFSGQTQKGLNIAAGIGSIKLETAE